jgi:hypothetical protein
LGACTPAVRARRKVRATLVDALPGATADAGSIPAASTFDLPGPAKEREIAPFGAGPAAGPAPSAWCQLPVPVKPVPHPASAPKATGSWAIGLPSAGSVPYPVPQPASAP